MNFLPKSNFELEIKARIKAESKPEPTSNIETIAKKVVSSQNDVQEQEDYKAKDGFNIKVEINDGELKNGLFILQTLKCGNEVKEVKKSSYLLSKPQTPENDKVAHDMEVKPKDFKVKLKDELMDDEFQNGLRVMETMKCGGTENDIKLRPISSLLPKTSEINDNVEEVETKTNEMKVKVEPKDEFENDEFQNGLRAMETMKCGGTENKVKNEMKLRPIASLLPKINENVEEVKIKPKEMKVKVEPKDEFENEELQSGLQVIETVKTNTLDAHGSNNQIRKCTCVHVCVHALQEKANVLNQCCPFCGNNKFASREALKRHMMKKHSNDKKLKKDFCFKCDKNFGLNRQFGRKYKLTPDYKINHLIGVYSDCVDSTLKKPNMVHYQCLLCGLGDFYSKKTLKDHMIKDHKNSKKLKKESCFKCGKKWYTKYGNRQSDYLREKVQKTHDCKVTHLLEVHLVMKEEENYLRNLQGGTETSSKVDLRKKSKVVPMPGLAKSAKLTRTDITIFKCFGCKKIFKTKELLDKHSHVHDRHITDNPWFKCSICDAVFSTVVFFNQHVEFKHQENLKVV